MSSLLPLFLGLTIVTQAVINRKISQDWGIANAVFLNACVFLFLSASVLIVSLKFPETMPAIFKKADFQSHLFKWWYLIPGTCGFLLVFGMPISLFNLGASQTFILVILAQIVLGACVDRFLYATEITSTQLIGAAIVIFGAYLYNKS